MKEDWEKYFKEKEGENPFEDYPIGVWNSTYCHFCPNCAKPVVLCNCTENDSTIKTEKVEKTKVD